MKKCFPPRNSAVAFCLVLLLQGFLAVGQIFAQDLAADEVVHLKLHHMLSSAAPGDRLMLLEWSEKIAEDSNGRLQIKVFPSMQLGGQAAAVLDQVRDGIVDIGWTLPGYTPGRYPNIEVFELPFMVRTPYVMNQAMYDFERNHPEEFASVKVL